MACKSLAYFVRLEGRFFHPWKVQSIFIGFVTRVIIRGRIRNAHHVFIGAYYSHRVTVTGQLTSKRIISLGVKTQVHIASSILVVMQKKVSFN